MEQHFLSNPSPKYYMGNGEHAYAAMDNAHGGHVYCGKIVGRAMADNDRAGYRFRYMSPIDPGVELEVTLTAADLFPDMTSIENARKNDRSVQDMAIRSACATKKKLVAFLVGRANLQENELAIVQEQIQNLNLSDDDDDIQPQEDDPNNMTTTNP